MATLVGNKALGKLAESLRQLGVAWFCARKELGARSIGEVCDEAPLKISAWGSLVRILPRSPAPGHLKKKFRMKTNSDDARGIVENVLH